MLDEERKRLLAKPSAFSDIVKEVEAISFSSQYEKPTTNSSQPSRPKSEFVGNNTHIIENEFD